MLRRYFQPELLEVGWGREGFFRINHGSVHVFKELASNFRKTRKYIYSSCRFGCSNSCGMHGWNWRHPKEDQSMFTEITPFGSLSEANCEHCRANTRNRRVPRLHKYSSGIKSMVSTLIVLHPEKSWQLRTSRTILLRFNHWIVLTSFPTFSSQKFN